MSKVTLEREVKDHAVVRDGRVVLVEDVKMLSVRFEDGKGGEVSFAFDGRADRSESPFSGRRREVYAPYSDCPVMLDREGVGTEHSGQVRDRVRALRDALNKLDLDD